MNIFLSYASEHREIAERIHLKLVNAGHEVFYDRQNLRPGHSFDLKIKEEIERCDLFVFLLTPESIEPGSYALTEVDLAQRKWLNPEGRVLVVDLGLHQGQSIPPYLRANILLSPKGDPASETLFAVENLGKQRSFQSAAETSAPVGGTPDYRRWLLPATLAIAALIGLWTVFHMVLKPSTQVIQAVNGMAAGGGISVGGDVNIDKGADDVSTKDSE